MSGIKTVEQETEVGEVLHDVLYNFFMSDEADFIFDKIEEGELTVAELESRVGMVLKFIFDTEKN